MGMLDISDFQTCHYLLCFEIGSEEKEVTRCQLLGLYNVGCK